MQEQSIQTDTYIINGKKIIIKSDVQKIVANYKQNTSNKNESGGIILGQISNGITYITKVSTPNIYDFSAYNLFIRNKEAAQIIVNYEFANSFGKTIYLGEWHTHPEETPRPSSQDIKMIKKQYKDSSLNIDYIILLIQGIKKIYLGIYDGKNFKGKIVN